MDESGQGSRRKALSEAHSTLGKVLRQARLTAGLTTRELGFSSGHVSNVEGGFVTPSTDFLALYIDFGADRTLVHGLLDEINRQTRLNRDIRRRATRTRVAEEVGPPQEVGEHTDSADVRRHYRVEAYEVAFELDAFGAIERVASRVDLRATTDGVRYYFTGHAIDESHRDRSFPRVTNLSGATLDRINKSPIGAFEMYFRLDRSINRADAMAHPTAYTLEINEDQVADPIVMYVAPPGAKCHTLSVSFMSPAIPMQLWWFAAPDTFLADQPRPSALLTADAAGRFQHFFDSLRPGWCYGFTWTWPPNLTSPSSGSK